jgi:hypothetical protein
MNPVKLRAFCRQPAALTTKFLSFENFPHPSLFFPASTNKMNITGLEVSENINQTKSAERQKNRVFTEIFSLQQAEAVLSNVERTQLKLIPKKYDVSRLQAALAEYKENLIVAAEEMVTIEFRLMQELQLWRLSLAQRDARITAYQLRRFCEESAGSINNQTIAALACFYRNMLPSFEVRSKFDYAVTQMFTVSTRANRRTVRVSSQDLIEHLQKLSVAWTGLPNDGKNLEEHKRREDAVAVFAALTTEVNGYTKLEVLLKSEFFKRLRRHKQYLGETFFAPEVAAASIVCNVEVGNKFNELVATENEHLQAALTSEFGNSDMLKAALEDNPNRSDQILEHLVPSFTEQNSVREALKTKDFEFSEIEKTISNLGDGANTAMNNEYDKTLESAVAADSATTLTNEFSSQSVNAAGEEFLKEDGETGFRLPELESAETEGEIYQAKKFSTLEKFDDDAEFKAIDYSTVVTELAKSNPNKNVLSNYMKASSAAELHKFDFAPFFSDDNELKSKPEEIALQRKVLRFIFQAEDFCRRKRDVDSPANFPNDNEIENLIEEMQLLGNSLRLAISEVTGEHKKERSNALLTTSNYLLEARLRLSSLNAKSSGKNIFFINTEKKTQPPPPRKLPVDVLENETHVEKGNEKKFDFPGLFNVDRKLLIALAAVIALAIGVFIINPYGNDAAIGDPDNPVKTLDLEKLRGGDKLTTATVNANEMFGVVKRDWSVFSPEQKNEILKQLLASGRDNGFASLTLLDSGGKIVARATEKEIKIN